MSCSKHHGRKLAGNHFYSVYCVCIFICIKHTGYDARDHTHQDISLVFISIKHTGYNARDHTHQGISLVHCADPGPFP